MYLVCISEGGSAAPIPPISLPSLDMARGCAVGFSKAQAAGENQAVISIYSNDVLIEAAAHTYWAQYDYKFAGEDE